MANVQIDPYSQVIARALNKEIDFDADDIRMALVDSDYAIDLAAHDYWNDVVADELPTALGYTVNGAALANKAVSVVAANSWSRAHAVSTAYLLNQLVRPSTGNGFVYRASVAGTSAGAAPTWPTVIGREVTDNTVVWTCVGKSVWRFTSDPVVWAAPFGATFRFAVMYDRTPATDATRPLISAINYGTNQTGQDGSFTLTPDSANGWLSIPLPN